MKKLISITFALALIGAGCSPAEKAADVPTPAKPETKQDSSATPQNDNAPAVISGETRNLVAAVTDDTWKTYTNKSLGFSFMWPTKGRYAPTWEVKFYKSDAPEIFDGCYKELSNVGKEFSQSKARVNEQTFCHTRAFQNEAATVYLWDTYSFVTGKTVAVISFEKLAGDSKIIECSDSYPNRYSVALGYQKFASCTAFDEDEYLKTLDGIVGTFKLNTVAE